MLCVNVDTDINDLDTISGQNLTNRYQKKKKKKKAQNKGYALEILIFVWKLKVFVRVHHPTMYADHGCSTLENHLTFKWLFQLLIGHLNVRKFLLNLFSTSTCSIPKLALFLTSWKQNETCRHIVMILTHFKRTDRKNA